MSTRRVWLLSCIFHLWTIFSLATLQGTCAAETILPPGFRPIPPGVHALIDGTIIPKPGEVLQNATIVIRDGYFEEVGTNVEVPADARIWDMHGKTIYAGFIESYLPMDATSPPVDTNDSEPVGSGTFASGGIGFYGAPGQKEDAGRKGPGYEVGSVTPEFRAVRDYSPDTNLLEKLHGLGFTTAVVAPGTGIIRGTSALVALRNDDPNALILKPDVFQHVAFDTSRDDRRRSYPASLMGVIAVIRQTFFDTQHYQLDHEDWAENRHARTRPPFNPSLEALGPAATGEMRVVIEPGSALMVDRASIVADELGLNYALISCGQEWRRPALAGKTDATFIVPVDFPELPKMPDDSDWDQVTLDQLRSWDWAPENPAVLREQGLNIALTTYGLDDKKEFRKNVQLAMDRGLTEDDALAALTTVPAKLCGMESLLGTIETGKIANLVIVNGATYFDPKAKVADVWIDGRHFSVSGDEKKPDKNEDADGEDESIDNPEDKDGSHDKDEKRRELLRVRVARSPLEGRGPITNAPSILIRDATIWTCGPDGIISNANLMILDGKIEKVGQFKAEPGPDTLVLDAQGYFVTPGLIDCHSHTAILGAVNESTLPSTAMVRIGDVVNSETSHLYEQLAGGLTIANLLHGSANPIGGQNCVIKLRDGAPPEKLKFTAAPPGIKFALGENVKQSNWGDNNATRFPQTRMGVRTFIENRFVAAEEYLQDWQAYETRGGVPPRRDLELEAIGEIIQGKRWIHCHSYRQDEILMLLRTMEHFGVQVGTLQHVLEGYKVADEIAAHGAGASCFADWWAYKFEVYDAIPYAGSLMHDRGVLVSFNSDSSDLARRLNTEAAKAVKFGGTPEEEALKFVTINPAKQLRIDQRVGSLESGKDADFVIWSGSPLDSTSVCLQTWIDGNKFFDRSLDAARTAALQKERAALLEKARQVVKGEEKENDDQDEAEEKFFRVSLEHQFDGVNRYCLDEEVKR